MKKSKGLLILLAIAIVISSFVACSSKPKYEDKVVTVTQAVTDEKGEVVTDKYGETVVEAVTDENGEAVTEVITVAQNKTEANSSGIANKPQSTKKADDKTTQKADDKTTKKEGSSKKEDSTSTTKKKKPSKTTTTTTTTEPTTLPPTTAVGDKDIDEDDIEVAVVLPLYSAYDANKYDLIVTMEKKTLTYKITDGCRGQTILITVPKKYKGEKANFALTVNEKEYSINGTIKKGLKIEFEKINILQGEDD